MSNFVLGCPHCFGALGVSMYQPVLKPFACARCGERVFLDISHGLRSYGATDKQYASTSDAHNITNTSGGV